MLKPLTSPAEQETALHFVQMAPFCLTANDTDKAAEVLGQPGSWYAYTLKDKWHWLANLQRLDFDSNLFGFDMARLNPLLHSPVWPDKDNLTIGRDFLRAVQRQAGDFIMARVASRDILTAQCLEKAGFSLVDVSVEWGLDLSLMPDFTERPGFAVQAWTEPDRGALMELAGSAFSDLTAYGDRFTVDARLRPFSGQLYKTWLKNCLNGQQADQVLVLKQQDLVAGFISLRLPTANDDYGWVVLNAISPALRGQGLYNHLLLAALQWLKANGARQARVRTKISQPAVIQAWSRLGGRQLSSDMSFHWWRGA